MKTSDLTVTDQFCGAGGSSEGVKRYAQKKLGNGIRVRLALNHWKLAIETHNTNHPETDHDCTDISACDPRRYPSTNILITSPECTNHSLAKGQKRKYINQGNIFDGKGIDPAAERSRATMWDVPRFAEYHRYEIIIVENVVDARYWVTFDAWLQAMHALGYLHECVYLNSMHAHPTPQSRDRMYVVFWKKGNKKPDLAIRPRAFCKHCCIETESYQSWKNSEKQFGKYRTQYIYRCPTCNKQVEPYYYAAFNCIDWSLPGTRIGDRKKALSPNTMKRIQYGIDKYWSEPSFVNIRFSSGVACRVKSAKDNPLTAQTGDNNIGLLNPLISTTGYPPMISSKEYDTKQQRIKDATKEPVFTQSTHANIGVVMPLIVENFGTSKSRPVDERLGCITGSGKYGLLSKEAVNSFLSYYYSGSDMASHISEAARTFCTNDRASLVSDVKPRIEDCYYRMLVAEEVKLGMAFDKSYIVLGNVKDQVKQLGNAVTPPAMELLIERTVQTLL